MMKKILLGCLGTVLALIVLLIGFLAYFGPDYGIFLFPPSPQDCLGKINQRGWRKAFLFFKSTG